MTALETFPLPVGERAASAASRVRGSRPIDGPSAPHPDPLPFGERGLTVFLADGVVSK